MEGLEAAQSTVAEVEKLISETVGIANTFDNDHQVNTGLVLADLNVEKPQDKALEMSTTMDIDDNINNIGQVPLLQDVDSAISSEITDVGSFQMPVEKSLTTFAPTTAGVANGNGDITTQQTTQNSTLNNGTFSLGVPGLVFSQDNVKTAPDGTKMVQIHQSQITPDQLESLQKNPNIKVVFRHIPSGRSFTKPPKHLLPRKRKKFQSNASDTNSNADVYDFNEGEDFINEDANVPDGRFAKYMRYNPLGKKKTGRPRSIPEPSSFDMAYRSLIKTNTKPTQVIINEFLAKLNRQHPKHTIKVRLSQITAEVLANLELDPSYNIEMLTAEEELDINDKEVAAIEKEKELEKLAEEEANKPPEPEVPNEPEAEKMEVQEEVTPEEEEEEEEEEQKETKEEVEKRLAEEKERRDKIEAARLRRIKEEEELEKIANEKKVSRSGRIRKPSRYSLDIARLTRKKAQPDSGDEETAETDKNPEPIVVMTPVPKKRGRKKKSEVITSPERTSLGSPERKATPSKDEIANSPLPKVTLSKIDDASSADENKKTEEKKDQGTEDDLSEKKEEEVKENEPEVASEEVSSESKMETDKKEDESKMETDKKEDESKMETDKKEDESKMETDKKEDESKTDEPEKNKDTQETAIPAPASEMEGKKDVETETENVAEVNNDNLGSKTKDVESTTVNVEELTDQTEKKQEEKDEITLDNLDKLFDLESNKEEGEIIDNKYRLMKLLEQCSVDEIRSVFIPHALEHINLGDFFLFKSNQMHNTNDKVNFPKLYEQFEMMHVAMTKEANRYNVMVKRANKVGGDKRMDKVVLMPVYHREAAESLSIESTSIDAHICGVQRSNTAQMIAANSFLLRTKMEPPKINLKLPEATAPGNPRSRYNKNKSYTPYNKYTNKYSSTNSTSNTLPRTHNNQWANKSAISQKTAYRNSTSVQMSNAEHKSNGLNLSNTFEMPTATLRSVLNNTTNATLELNNDKKQSMELSTASYTVASDASKQTLVGDQTIISTSESGDQFLVTEQAGDENGEDVQKHLVPIGDGQFVELPEGYSLIQTDDGYIIGQPGSTFTQGEDGNLYITNSDGTAADITQVVTSDNAEVITATTAEA